MELTPALAKILNLTQHVATPEQVNQGVLEPTEIDKKVIQKLITFENFPSHTEMENRAVQIREIVEQKYTGISHVMIGGAPYFLPYLAQCFTLHKIVPLHSFAKRYAVEAATSDGAGVEKKSVFRHEGFTIDPYWLMLNSSNKAADSGKVY